MSIELTREKLNQELNESIDEYINLYSDESCLDGWFTAEELRLIADKMDELDNLTVNS